MKAFRAAGVVSGLMAFLAWSPLAHAAARVFVSVSVSPNVVIHTPRFENHGSCAVIDGAGSTTSAQDTITSGASGAGCCVVGLPQVLQRSHPREREWARRYN